MTSEKKYKREGWSNKRLKPKPLEAELKVILVRIK
jgi:hypothetical protein